MNSEKIVLKIAFGVACVHSFMIKTTCKLTVSLSNTRLGAIIIFTSLTVFFLLGKSFLLASISSVIVLLFLFFLRPTMLRKILNNLIETDEKKIKKISQGFDCFSKGLDKLDALKASDSWEKKSAVVKEIIKETDAMIKDDVYIRVGKIIYYFLLVLAFLAILVLFNFIFSWFIEWLATFS
jgi:hypothetical protein